MPLPRVRKVSENQLLFSTGEADLDVETKEDMRRRSSAMSQVSFSGEDRRLFHRTTGKPTILRRGTHMVRFFKDLYHSLLESRWGRLFGVLILIHLGWYMFFGLLYFAGFNGGGLRGVEGDDFPGHMFFSVQTQTTIGYGGMTPVGYIVHTVVSLQASWGNIFEAFVVGLLFAKFSSPNKRRWTITFSQIACISEIDGKWFLMFRVINAREEQNIAETYLRLLLCRNELDDQDNLTYRVYELKVPTMHQSPLLGVPCLIYHEIDRESPLYGITPESFEQTNSEIICILEGTEEFAGQDFQTRFSWVAMDVRWNHVFVSIMDPKPEDGYLIIDISKINQTEILTHHEETHAYPGRGSYTVEVLNDPNFQDARRPSSSMGSISVGRPSVISINSDGGRSSFASTASSLPRRSFVAATGPDAFVRARALSAQERSNSVRSLQETLWRRRQSSKGSRHGSLHGESILE